MDHITDFVVNIDISNCNLLYDYGRQEYYKRPKDGEWDLSALRAKCEEETQSETCVRLMDKALTRWGALEEDYGQHLAAEELHSKPSSSKHRPFLWRSISTIPTLPKRLMPVYAPGDAVSGYVRLEVKQPIEADNVHVTFKGAARVLVRVHHGRGFRDASGSHKYVDQEAVLWKKGDKESEREDPASSKSPFESDADQKHLSVGLRKFHFAFALPPDAHSSCPPIVESSTDYAHILYRLKAVIDKGKPFKWGNIVSGHAIWVVRDYDIATVRQAMLPVIAHERISTGLVHTGHVTCKAGVPHHAYVRGDVIPLSLVVENADGHEIHAVTARVRLGGTVYPQPRSPGVFRSINLKSEKVKVGAIPAGTSQKFSLELPLHFHEVDDNLLPAVALHDCPLIEIRYEVVVKLKRRGLHRSIELKIPITVGTKDSSCTD